MRRAILASVAVAAISLFAAVNQAAAQDNSGWPRPWGSTYRPACPYHYFYDCRPGPYGRVQCACWPW